MASARPLRIATIASFVPAFPLSVAHGVLSRSAVPAVGLVPLACSAGTSIFLLLRRAPPPRHNDDSPETGGGEAPEGEPAVVPSDAASNYPLLVFLIDAVTAVALMVVLVFTWIRTSGPTQLAVLGTYATIPLLVNFFIHLYLAVREFSRGLALHSLTQRLAWQALPPDCPHCGNRLRPSSPPHIPWYHEFSFPFSAPTVRFPALPTWQFPAPSWETPSWLKGRTSRGGYTSLFVNDDEESRYRDDDPAEHDGGPSTRVEEPAEVEVVGKKKDRKSKDSPVSGVESRPWET